MSRPSQTLLEAILAIGIIMTATIGATTLVVSTITSGRTSQDKIIAANLAREGLEVVRGTRDSNWLQRSQNVLDDSGSLYRWDSAPASLSDIISGLGPQGNLYYCFSLSKTTFTADWTFRVVLNGNPDGTVSSCTASVPVLLASSATDKYYTQGPCPLNYSCAPTKFLRTVQVQRDSESLSFGSAEFLRVTSIVDWNDHGQKEYALTEKLYDWR